MILLRLKINESFRCLHKGFELYFYREWDKGGTDGFAPYVLAGPNGSGKSNVLEVLAAIFYHIECQYLIKRPDSFDYDEEENPNGFRDEVATPNAFELEYFIIPPATPEYGDGNAYAHIKIVKELDSGARVYMLNHPDGDEPKLLPRMEAWEMLPEFVLGYSSGENEILSLPFFKMRFINYDEYIYDLTHQSDYSGAPEGNLIFLDAEMNQAILICNFLLQDEETLRPFKEDVGIEKLKQFRIIIRQHRRIEFNQDVLKDLKMKDPKGQSRTRVELTSALKKVRERDDGSVRKSGIIYKLEQCATCTFYDDETDSLYLDYWVTPATKEAFKNHFSSIIELFQSFQVLLTLNLYSVSDALKKDLYQSGSLYVNETVPVLPSDERVMRFKNLVLNKNGVNGTLNAKSLSDGEHQFLHSLGLCLLYKDTQSLFLLDEPETHFNPDWRSKLISRLKECFSHASRKVSREMLITTHTPFLISDSRPEKVLIFEKVKDRVNVARPDYNTLGASINKITMKTFGKRETIGGYAQQLLDDLKLRFEMGEDRENLLDEIDDKLGDSVEKVLLIKTILDSMEKDAI